jgi:hypothetical protein
VEAAVSSTATSGRRFFRRLAITSFLSFVEMVNFVLFSPTVYREIASDPTLEGVFSVLLAVWAWSLGRMWFLTFKD